MVAAHAFTRNKNQGGGGYNYNFPDILGFSQINEWMISGPNIMPVVGEINPTEGMAGWKSPFKHESEIIQPGYHRLYLDRYKTCLLYTSNTIRSVASSCKFGYLRMADVILFGSCEL